MNTYAIEVITGVALFVLFLIVLFWQRNRKLAQAEVDNYVHILEKELPTDLEDRADVMRFFDELRQVPGAPKTRTPREVNFMRRLALARCKAAFRSWPETQRRYGVTRSKATSSSTDLFWMVGTALRLLAGPDAVHFWTLWLIPITSRSWATNSPHLKSSLRLSPPI